MGAPRLLVIEGNTAEGRARSVAAGGAVASDHYAKLLRSLLPGAAVDICLPADPGANLPDKAGLAAYDGVAMTGSALNAYDRVPAVDAQVELAREVFRSGTPFFGSCWGLQVATVAAGGSVRANPKGREIGIGRSIALTVAGEDHPLYDGKGPIFDAITVHMDEVDKPAPGTTILATNAWTAIQAAEIRAGDCVFWGTQYHPEYTFGEIAAVFKRLKPSLVAQGLFRGDDDHAAYVEEMEAFERDPNDRSRAWRHGAGASVLDPEQRTRELKNWISFQVLPTRSARGRG